MADNEPTTQDLETAEEAVTEELRSEDLWLAGTELPGYLTEGTDEGEQKLYADESEERLVDQTGTRLGEDALYEDETSDDEKMIINMGPQHPSTHGVLRLNLELEGETIRRVKPIIGYLHTGMEKTAETLKYFQGSTNVTRMDYLAPLHNELCFSLAVEKLLEVDIPPRAQAIRILTTEMNRVSSHLVALATGGIDIGAMAMMFYGLREREYFLNFFESLTGLRMNHNYIRPGGVAADLHDGWQDELEAILDRMPSALHDFDELLEHNAIWKGRTQGVGVITPEQALAHSITGPILRSTGVPHDLRKMAPYSGIEQYDFDVITGQYGDAYDRYRVRALEIAESLKIIKQVADSMPAGDYKTNDRKISPPPRKRIDESMEALIHHFKLHTEGFKVPAGEAYVAIESPRGELGCYIVSDGSSQPLRMHTRAPSFANLQSLPIMLADAPIADAIASLASVDPVLGDVDR